MKKEIVKKVLASCNACDGEVTTPNVRGYCDDCIKANTPEARCTKCRWIHEADSVAKTSFMGVGLCPLHAAAPELLEAAKRALQLLDRINPQSIGGECESVALMDAIAKAEGRS